MKRQALITHLADVILHLQKRAPLLVGIDGVDASGKTTLANELAEELKQSDREIIRASIDGFHNPKHIRYGKGKNSPEGYYEDSFNIEALCQVLLDPLRSGTRRYQTAIFDYRIDSAVSVPVQLSKENSILLMEGIFLFRPELVKYWDVKIFLDVPFTITVQRAIKRAAERAHIGNEQEIIDAYQKRYIPGQEIYFAQAHPKEQANIIIDNSDVENPVLLKKVLL